MFMKQNCLRKGAAGAVSLGMSGSVGGSSMGKSNGAGVDWESENS